MKTIALKEKTFQLMKDLKERENSTSFDELVLTLILKRDNIQDSMFGSLKSKAKRFTSHERDEMWKDVRE